MAIQRPPLQSTRASLGIALAASAMVAILLQGCASSPTPEGGAPAPISTYGTPAQGTPAASAQPEPGILAGTIEAVRPTLLDDAGGRREGLAIDVRLDNGERRTIMQEADVSLHPGERVRLVTGDGAARVAQ